MDSASIPWERRAELGFFRAYVDTMRGALFAPVATFKKLAGPCSARDALLYDLLTWLIAVGLPSLPEAFSFDTSQLPAVPGINWQSFKWISWVLTLVPFTVLLNLVMAVLIHGCLRLLGGGGGEGGLARTYASQVYGSSPAIFNALVIALSSFSAVTLVLSLVPLLWGTYNIIVALREAQRVSGGRATVAVVVPYLALDLTGMAVILLFLLKLYTKLTGSVPFSA